MAVTALVFAPDRGSQVRIRLAAGGRWIRTTGPPTGTALFEPPRSSARGPPFRDRGDRSRRKGKAVPGARHIGFASLRPGIKPPGLPSAGEAMPRQEGGHEQLSAKRA